LRARSGSSANSREPRGGGAARARLSSQRIDGSSAKAEDPET
jgi:hypothetical protein